MRRQGGDVLGAARLLEGGKSLEEDGGGLWTLWRNEGGERGKWGERGYGGGDGDRGW